MKGTDGPPYIKGYQCLAKVMAYYRHFKLVECAWDG